MSLKADKDKTKQLQDKCLSVLNALLRDEDNKYCVDCDSKGPRWASWNLGVFLCIRCAGIHRNLGVHISKVKSVNLDSWTPEQVVSLQQMGNSRARAVYEANLPDNFRRPQNDSSLETFIRAKYEHKKYIAREWVPPTLPEVNWEKEIDEEIERQKRKKKSAVVEKKSLGAVEVPQLPKPKNASPKPGRVQSTSVATQPAKSATPETKSSNTSDLLGLQNGDDSFSNFLSAPVPTNNSANNATPKKDEKEVVDIKSEEESFFNQTVPTEKEKAKLTKDSILALYATAPPVNNFNPSFNAQPAQFNANFSAGQSNFQNFNAFGQNVPQQPQNFAPMQNGMQFGANQFSQQQTQQPQQQQQQHFQPNQFSSQQFGMQNTMPVQQQQQAPNYQFTNQFTPNSGGMMTNNQFQPMNQFQSTQQPQGSNNMFPNAMQPQANPFFNQSTLPMQFGNMSLGGANGSAQPTVTTNIWQ